MQYELCYKKNTLMKKMGKGNIIGKMDYRLRTMVVDCSMNRNVMAVASLNSFFVYSL